MSVFDPNSIEELESLLGDGLFTLLALFRTESAEILQGICAAIAGDNRAELRLLAHSLKGSSSNLGAGAIYSCCMRLEHAAKNAEPNDLGALLAELTERLRVADAEILAKLAAAGRE